MRRLVQILCIGVWVWFFAALALQDAEACVPVEVGGTGKGLTTGNVHSPVVLWAAWWCPPSSGIGPYTRRAVAWGPTHFADPAAWHDALTRRDWAWLESRATWAPDHPEMLRSVNNAAARAIQEAARPADLYTYRVAPNLPSLSRPVYEFANGVRGTREVARAAVGAGCNHNLPRSGAYMTFAPDFAPNRVTLCK